MATLFRPVAQGVATDLTRGAVAQGETTDLTRGAVTTDFWLIAQGETTGTDLTRGAVTTDLARGAVTTDLTRGEATWTDLTAGTAGTAGRTEAWRGVGRTTLLRRSWGSASGSTSASASRLLTICSTGPFLAMYLGRPRVCPRRVEWAVYWRGD